MKANPLQVVLLFLAGLQGGVDRAHAQLPSLPEAESLPAPTAPVLLVPGWLRGSKELTPVAERLRRDGWPEDWILALDFQDPVGSNVDHAREIDGAIAELRSRTGMPRVDVIAHSMGGLALWVLLQQEGDVLPIHRVVFLGSPLQGTVTAYLAWGKGGEEMRPGSEFLRRLEAGPKPNHWVEALTIRTPLDLHVLPGEGGTLPGVGDQVVCCPTHQGLQDHEETFRLARDFLLFGRSGRERTDSLVSGRM